MVSKHRTEGMHYEGNCIRPPPEAESILLQVTLGCSHNKCTFCGTFKNKQFNIKDDEIILNDILYASEHMKDRDKVFLMDGDALIIPQTKLMWIFEKIQEHLPWVKRVGAYANTKSIRRKALQELLELRKKKLGILYLGVESGDDKVRDSVVKGSTARQCLEMGRKVKDTGIQLATLVLLGIAGKEKSLEHARATGEIISSIDPEFCSALTLILIPGTPLYQDYMNEKFEMPDKVALLKEMREMIEYMNVTHCIFSTNHASNYLPVRMMFPEGKQEVLKIIDSAIKGDINLRPEWMRGY